MLGGFPQSLVMITLPEIHYLIFYPVGISFVQYSMPVRNSWLSFDSCKAQAGYHGNNESTLLCGTLGEDEVCHVRTINFV